jgi:hypothetical protein
MKVKKTHVLILTTLAAAMLGSSAAFAEPKNPIAGPKNQPAEPKAPRVQMRKDSRIPDTAPEDIKNADKEMRSVRKDLRLELQKDHPDREKAMSLFKRAEELRTKVREWEINQILDGNAPKPGSDEKRSREFREEEFREKEFRGRPNPQGYQVPAGMPAWGPGWYWQNHYVPYGGCRCGQPMLGQVPGRAPVQAPVQNGVTPAPADAAAPVPQTPAAN